MLRIAVEINDVSIVDIIFIYYNEIGNTLATENQQAKIKCANEVKYRQIFNEN